MLPWRGELRTSPAGSANSCPVPRSGPGHMVAEWVSTGLDANQYHSLPQASSGPRPLPPASTLVRVRGQAGLHLGFLPLHPGPLGRLSGWAWDDRAAASPRGRQTVPELCQGKLGPKPERCPEGKWDQSERRGCVGFDRKAINLSFGKPEVPLALSSDSLCPL